MMRIRQPRRWPWTVAAVAIATTLAAVRIRARRGAVTDDGEPAPVADLDDAPNSPPTARQKATTAANQAAGRALTAARHARQTTGAVIAQVRNRIAQRQATQPDATDPMPQAESTTATDTGPPSVNDA